MVKKTLHKRLQEEGYSVIAIGDLNSLQRKIAEVVNYKNYRCAIVPGELVQEVFRPGEFGCNSDFQTSYVFYSAGCKRVLAI